MVLFALGVALGTPILIEDLDVTSQDRWILAITTIAVAYHEEIAFRAVLQEILVRRFGVFVGIALTCACFLAFHYGVVTTSFFNAAQIVTASIILGLVYARTGSILTVMAFHALYDAFESVPRLFPPHERIWGLTLLVPATMLVIVWYLRQQAGGAKSRS